MTKPTEQIVKAIFGWDYNIWCRCHYYGEFGHIAMNCVKHHMRKMDTTKRFFICTELSHLAKNYMNFGRIEDEKKARANNIRKQMRQKWIPKSLEDTSPSNTEPITQELGDTTIFVGSLKVF